jgi:hypothetical protein
MKTTLARARSFVSAISGLLLQEKTPYLLTVFMAVVGYAAAQAVDGYKSPGLIEYTLEKTAPLGDIVAIKAMRPEDVGTGVYLTALPDYFQAGYILTLRNMSSTGVLKCGRFDIMLLPRLGSPNPTISGWLTSTTVGLPVRSRSAENNGSPRVEVYEMQPGAELSIRLNTSNVGDISLFPSACESEGGKAGEIPVVKPPSVMSLIVRYGSTLLVLGSVLIITLLIFSIRRRRIDSKEV